MPILIFLVTVIGGAAIWYYRARAAKDALDTVADAAMSARGRIRQARFKRQANVHPAEQVEDPREAAAGIAATVAVEQAPWSAEVERRLTLAIARHLDTEGAEAAEIATFARWLSAQDNPAEMRRRLIRRLDDLAGAEALPGTLSVLEEVCGVETDDPADPVAQARRDLHRRLA